MPIRLRRDTAGDPPPGISQQIIPLIDAALLVRREGETRRDYLGASSLADECARRLAFAYRGEDPAPADARTLRIFELGDSCEVLLVRWLRIAGFDLRDLDDSGRRYGFSAGDDRVRGNADGVIHSGPDIGVTYPVLFEAKSASAASFSDLVARGVAQSKPVYYGQIQAYLLGLGLKTCLFAAVHKDSAKLYFELIDLDLGRARRLIDRAVAIVDTADHGRLPPILEDKRACRGCDYAKPCGGDDKAAGPPHLPAPGVS